MYVQHAAVERLRPLPECVRACRLGVIIHRFVEVASLLRTPPLSVVIQALDALLAVRFVDPALRKRRARHPDAGRDVRDPRHDLDVAHAQPFQNLLHGAVVVTQSLVFRIVRQEMLAEYVAGVLKYLDVVPQILPEFLVIPDEAMLQPDTLMEPDRATIRIANVPKGIYRRVNLWHGTYPPSLAHHGHLRRVPASLG